MILVNPTFRELSTLRPPSSVGVRAVVVGDHIAIGDAMKYVHDHLFRRLVNTLEGRFDDYPVELFVDARTGEFSITCTSYLPDDVRSWHDLVRPKHIQTLEDICKILEDGIYQ